MKNKKLSINIIGKVPLPIGGVTIHTLRLFQWLKKDNDFDVKLTALNKNNIDDKNIQYAGNFILWVFKKLLFGFKEDIVHYQGANYYGLVILSIIKKIHPNFIFVWGIHSEYLINKLKNKLLFNFTIKQINNIIADNINIKQQLLDIGYLSSNIDIVSPFLMPDDYNKEEFYLLDKYRKDNNIILLFNAYKIVFNDKGKDVYGLNTLIKAFEQIDLNYILILLIPIIDTKEKMYLDSLLNSIDMDRRKNIILISDNEISGWKYINSCDIFIRPTITDGDALSIKEALYMNIPTIASDCTVRPNDIVLFKTDDFNDLSIKIMNISFKNKKNINQEDNISLYKKFYNKIKDKK
jgi:hypothetical protein